jgi:hypothetical protein
MGDIGLTLKKLEKPARKSIVIISNLAIPYHQNYLQTRMAVGSTSLFRRPCKG